MLRIIKDPDDLTMAAGPDDVAQVLADAPPGRYAVEEVAPAGELLPSGHSSRRWGAAIRHADGRVTLDPDPWPARTREVQQGGRLHTRHAKFDFDELEVVNNRPVNIWLYAKCRKYVDPDATEAE